MESFYESVGGRMISGRAVKLDTIKLGQGVEELRFKLTCLEREIQPVTRA
jgi:hypothetical protein